MDQAQIPNKAGVPDLRNQKNDREHRRVPPPDDKEQSDLFLQKAREIEADEQELASDQLLGRAHS